MRLLASRGAKRDSMHTSEQVALSEKVKVECDFREYREWPHTLGNNVYACGIGAMKNVVMGAS